MLVGKPLRVIGRGVPAWQWVAAASLLLLVVAAGSAAWLRPWWSTVVEAASVERMAFPLPDKPSIAVLPFKNMSGEPEQDYFVDGLTDDLITDLSKVSGLFIIARDSVFPFKGRDAKVRDVAESLGVRYVVDGSVRRVGNAVRVNVQLIDALTGSQLWADRYDGDVNDIFAVQDKFVRVIVDALALKLSKDEEQEISRGQTQNIDAREAFQKGWEHPLGSRAKTTPWRSASSAKPSNWILNTGERPPHWAWPCSGVAPGVGQPPDINRSQACELASRYREETTRQPSSFAHVVATYINLILLDHQAAFTEAARALALDPNDPEASVAMAWVMITTGRPKPRLNSCRRRRGSTPAPPSHYALARGLALFSSGALVEAARVLEEALARSPSATVLAPPLAATYAQLGRRKEAREILLRWKPNASQEELSDIALDYPYTHRWSSDGQKALDRLVDGMIIAALPLDITVSELADAMHQGGPFERAHAARTLARFGPQAADAVPALVRALDDPSPVVRGAAITALGRIGPKAKTAVPALTGIQDDQLRSMADAAVKAIKPTELLSKSSRPVGPALRALSVCPAGGRRSMRRNRGRAMATSQTAVFHWIVRDHMAPRRFRFATTRRRGSRCSG